MRFPFVNALRAVRQSKTPERGKVKNNAPSLRVEQLESRDMMSVTSLFNSTYLGAPATSSSVSTIYNFPQPTAAGNALINKLWDGNLRSVASADYNRDGQITRSDMIELLAKGTYQYAFLTPTAAHDLITLVSNGATVAMPDYVQNLASKTLSTSGATGYYGAGLLTFSYYNQNAFIYENVAGIGIGQQVKNWFLGTVRPDPNLYNAKKQVTVAATYQQAPNLPLFAKGGPVYQDVSQGQVGDCWLMASLAEVADRTPSVIKNMFIDNGDNTYTVRFFNGGKADYVTVDKYLPNSGYTYDYPANDLWVALAEKAYAQECGSSWIGTNTPGASSYGALNGGDPSWALSAITGKTATNTGIWSRVTYPDLSVLTNAGGIAGAWSQGLYVVLTTGSPSSSQVVGNHCYAMVDYSSGQYTLFNPWGTGGAYGGDGKYYPGFFKGNVKSMAANFIYWSQAGAEPGAAVPQTMGIFGVFHADARLSVGTPADKQPTGFGRDSTVFAVTGGAELRTQLRDDVCASLARHQHQRVAPSSTHADAAVAVPFAGHEMAARWEF
jgi:hypothetical protein